MAQYDYLQQRIITFSEKSEKIIAKKAQNKSCNFSAVKMYFNALKKDYDTWFFLLVDVF